MKKSLGLEKKTMVSKALAESSNLGENKTELKSSPDALGRLLLPGTYHPLPRNLSPPTSVHHLSPPDQGTYHPQFNYKCHLN